MDSQNQQASTTNYKEAFSLFDKRGSGRVPLENLGDLLRACGQNPTLAEIEALEQNAGGDCTCTAFSFKQRDRLTTVLANTCHSAELPDESR